MPHKMIYMFNQLLTSKQPLNKAYLKEKVLRIEIEKFKSNLQKLLNNVDYEE